MQDQSFKILAESQNFVLGHTYETAILLEKANGVEIAVADHYGDPTVGLISSDECWFVTAGEGLQCFSKKHGLLTFFRSGFPLLAQTQRNQLGSCIARDLTLPSSSAS